MKLLVNEAKLTGLWTRNWATILTGYDLKFALVFGLFEKQAPGQLIDRNIED